MMKNCNSSSTAGGGDAQLRDVTSVMQTRRRVTSLPPDIQHGVVRYEAEFLGEWAEARTVLFFPRQQQRVGRSLRARQTHTVSDLQRHNRRSFPLNLTRTSAVGFGLSSAAVLHHHGAN